MYYCYVMLNEFIYSMLRPVDQWLGKKSAGTMLTIGESAPDFTVKTHDGKTIGLQDFRGKNIVLWFFPKADTPG